MKWWASVLLIILGWTILLPSAPAHVFLEQPGHEVLSDVDVCHSAAPAVSTSGDMPCINESSSSPVPSLTAVFAQQFQPVLTQLILSTQNGHPPKA
jgi:hypothetical protein